MAVISCIQNDIWPIIVIFICMLATLVTEIEVFLQYNIDGNKKQKRVDNFKVIVQILLNRK